MWTRREVLKTFTACGALMATPGLARRALAAEPDLVLRLTAAPSRVRIWPGPETHVMRFAAEVLHGRPDAVRASSSYLGPTLQFDRGERVRIQFENRIDEECIVHWHGMIVPEVADGHPRFAVGPGGRYTYEFTVRNPVGTYLYHPHPHGRTGRQVYHGLAGLVIVREPWEHDAGLPPPLYDLSLIIQDRLRGSDNRLVFKRMMMDDMNGVLGNEMLVNGMPDAVFQVAPRVYRLRLANISNARIYKLAWSDERPLHVIAADNGLFNRAEGVQVRPYVTLAPFERIELLEDFGTRRGGAEVALVSRPFADSAMEGMMGGMMGGMMQNMMGAAQGEELLVARFAVGSGTRIPGEPIRLPEAAPRAREPRRELHTQLSFRHMRGFLNGRSFDMTAVTDDERLPLGAGTIWTFSNDGRGMPMSHPIHIHGVRFRILERSRGIAPADLREGLLDTGFKDTFLIFPGEWVRVLVVPTEPGLFMYHCHNLEHEDGGMMRNCLFSPHPIANV